MFFSPFLPQEIKSNTPNVMHVLLSIPAKHVDVDEG
jgi:hypothetical protein